MIVLSLFRGLIEVPAPRLTMREIAMSVAEKYGLTLLDLMGESRLARIAHPRQEAMWLIRQGGRCSLPMIGRFFGRDHTTILHGVRAHELRIAASSTREIAA